MKLQRHINRLINEKATLGVFGLIVFTEKHPHVIKTLRDEDYWREFDRISGDNFAIFSAQPLPGAHRAPEPRPGVVGTMNAVWHEPAENEELLSTFRLDDTKDLPTFVVFAQMPDGTILQSSIKLTDNSAEEAYRRLKTVISVVSEAAKGIADEYKANTEDVHAAFVQQIREFHERETLLEMIKWVPFVAKVIKMVC